MSEANTSEIRIAGFGGQGVILAGMILGKGATIFENRHATLVQSFGPEARGGSCSAQVVLSDQPIAYPYVARPRILVAMSQEAFERFAPDLAPNGLLVYEQDLVKVHDLRPDLRSFGIPATRIAEELRRRMVLNIVMVGFVAAVTGLVGVEAARKAVVDSVPKGTEHLNVTAFDKGCEYGRRLIAGGPAGEGKA
ncbi:MAG: 2-oxoacid:acceptor oxidoreductase family protein [Deltaproteobacteria bacterium]|nr:2-oxoacid:acceptor oxidoreductase family protein [Deltaproteobacteria bacterium]